MATWYEVIGSAILGGGIKGAFDLLKARVNAPAQEAQAEAAQVSAEAEQATAEAAKVSADAELQRAVNEAVKIALENMSTQIDALEAKVAKLTAERDEAIRQRDEAIKQRDEALEKLTSWELISTAVNEAIARKHQEYERLQRQLVEIERLKNEAETELAKKRAGQS